MIFFLHSSRFLFICFFFMRKNKITVNSMGGSWTPPICPDIKNVTMTFHQDEIISIFRFQGTAGGLSDIALSLSPVLLGEWKKNNRNHSMADPSRYEKNIHSAVGNRTGICKYLPATMFVFPRKKVKQIGGLLSTITKTLAQCLKKTALYSCEIYFLWTILKMNPGMKKKIKKPSSQNQLLQFFIPIWLHINASTKRLCKNNSSIFPLEVDSFDFRLPCRKRWGYGKIIKFLRF